jgi:DNA-binding MarR family transcriptional regulator
MSDMATKLKLDGVSANPWENVTDSGRGLHIDQFLTFHLIRLANSAKTNVTRRYLIDHGLSVPEWRLLALAMRFAPLRFSEMVERSNMDKGQVSRTLQQMVKRGYISAKPIGPKTKRARETISLPVIVSVTQKGRKSSSSLAQNTERLRAKDAAFRAHAIVRGGRRLPRSSRRPGREAQHCASGLRRIAALRAA